MAKAKPEHYVDNKRFFQELMAYKNAVAAAGLGEKPPIPEYIGECILLIAQRLANKPNFASYSFRDDMISDAVENCVTYLLSFNPDKSNNPFAYYTQFCTYAFWRRIQREKKQVYTKYKYAIHKTLLGEDHTAQVSEDPDLKQPSWMKYDNVISFIRDYENRPVKERRKVLLSEDDDPEDFFDSGIPLNLFDDVAKLESEIVAEDAMDDAEALDPIEDSDDSPFEEEVNE